MELVAPVQSVSAQSVQKERLVQGVLDGRGVELPAVLRAGVIGSRRPGVLAAVLPRSPVETQEVPGWHLRGLAGVKVPVPRQGWHLRGLARALRGRAWHSSLCRALGTALVPCRAQLGGRGTQRGRHNVGCWNGHLGFDGME